MAGSPAGKKDAQVREPESGSVDTTGSLHCGRRPGQNHAQLERERAAASKRHEGCCTHVADSGRGGRRVVADNLNQIHERVAHPRAAGEQRVLLDRRHRGEVTHRDRQGAALAAKQQRQTTRSGEFIWHAVASARDGKSARHHKSEEIRVAHRDRSL